MPSIVDEIIEVYHLRGDRSYGENVTEREHALQCAAFALQFGEPDHVVLASLLHDYGHLCHDLGEDIATAGHDALHEELGYEKLRIHFPPVIVEPVRLHVAAKRYLCGKHPAYLEGLSQASRTSLYLQGGPMMEAELREFENRAHFADAVKVRRYDDMGKVPGMQTETFESYRPLMEAFLLAS